jgi:putative SOS response-associated peptidase YedK
MCGRFNFSSLRGYERHYNLKHVPFEIPPHSNIAPGMEVPIVRRSDGQNRSDLMRWGLVPSWSKDATVGYCTIKARSETVTQKPAFAQAFRSRRCLVPANSFFEWQGQGTTKIPYSIFVVDQPIFSMAGLWDSWRDGLGHSFDSFTILTTTANQLVSPIHDRMPVILSPADEAVWLDPQASTRSHLRQLLVPYPAIGMEACPVSPLVNAPRNDVPEVLRPL